MANLDARTTLVIGLGASGVSVVRFLQRLQEPNHDIIAFDDEPQSAALCQQLAPAIVTNDSSSIPWQRITRVIQSPGIPFFPTPHPVTAMAQRHRLWIESDIDLFEEYRAANMPHVRCVGVTGTNGKSTTCALIHHILQTGYGQTSSRLGGNIGTPILDTLKAAEAVKFYVLELSSFQLDITRKLTLDLGIVLNITPDHLNRHETMANYIAAKHRILSYSKQCLWGHDVPIPQAILEKTIKEKNAKPKPFGQPIPDILQPHQAPLVSRLVGAHNAENINAAVATCREFGVTEDAIWLGLKTFPGLPHRLETVATTTFTRVVNDSKATNAESVSKALASFNNHPIFWIAGGQPKEEGIAPLASLVGQVRGAFFYGQARNDFAATAKSWGVPFSITCVDTLEEATQLALAATIGTEAENGPDEQQNETIVLFSPACASFDQFRHFEHRGDCFRQCVNEWLSKKA